MRTTLLTPVALGILAALPPIGAIGATGGAGAWYSTGALGTARTRHAAAILTDGRVLVAGGTGGGALKSAAVYDPGLGSWAPTGDLGVARADLTLTVLANGKVLAVGGSDGSIFNQLLNSAELYDPATGIWTLVAPMNTTHQRHTATRLADGRVLISGRASNPALSVEIYTPATNSWATTSPMLMPRGGAAATLLANGKVLTTGGYGGGEEALATTELYNPATNQWAATGNLLTGRRHHTITPLADGRVLIAGGADGSSSALASAEIYNPQSGTWTAAGALATRRIGHTAIPLLDGRVLVAGGFDNTGADDVTLGSAEVYDPATNAWSGVAAMSQARENPVAVRLANGRAFVVGGTNEQLTPLASAEIFDPTATAIIYPLTVSVLGPGTVAINPPGGQYQAGTVVTATASPQPGAFLIGWERNGVAAGWPAQLAVTMSGPRALSATFAAPATFPDVPAGDPAWVAVAQLGARGIIKGYEDGRFGPADGTLRAQLAALLCRACGWAAQDWGNPFNDQGATDADLWRNVGTLAHYGVAQGYGDGAFGPADPILRAQAISLIARALVAQGYWQAQPDDPALFTNVPAASGHRQDLATYAHFAGPLPDEANAGQFAGWDEPGTRAWFARALWRALDRTFGQ